MTQFTDDNAFKICPSCKQTWDSREDFIADPLLELVGYQAHFKNLEQGLFLFNHLACKSTISVQSGRFADLYHGPLYTKNLLGTDSCPEYCLFKTNLKACPTECECTYIRDIMQIIKGLKKGDPHNNNNRKPFKKLSSENP